MAQASSVMLRASGFSPWHRAPSELSIQRESQRAEITRLQFSIGLREMRISLHILKHIDVTNLSMYALVAFDNQKPREGNLMRIHALSDVALAELKRDLSSIASHPYRNYVSFREEIGAYVQKREDFLQSIMKPVINLFADKTDTRKVALIKSCPIDDEIPVFDFSDPVNNKRSLKMTYISEAFLEIISQILDIPILAYTTRNDGDFFQDVYYHKKYSSTQTQKTDSELYFHNDRTAHFVRADLPCLLGPRADAQNVIVTTYVHGEDVLDLLDDDTKIVLRQRYFVTPFDPVSQDSHEFHTCSERHAIIIGKADLRYHDVRTTVAEGSPPEAWQALVALKNAITRAPKTRVPIGVGDLFIFPNLAGLHSRDKVIVVNDEAARQRYLLKTYNFWSTTRRDAFKDVFVDGVPGLVDDDKLYGNESLTA